MEQKNFCLNIHQRQTSTTVLSQRSEIDFFQGLYYQCMQRCHFQVLGFRRSGHSFQAPMCPGRLLVSTPVKTYIMHVYFSKFHTYTAKTKLIKDSRAITRNENPGQKSIVALQRLLKKIEPVMSIVASISDEQANMAPSEKIKL